MLDYAPAHLEQALYAERAGFDYGGTVFVHPMAELPYWRVVMARKQAEPRWVAFAAEQADVIAAVRAHIAAAGPATARDLAAALDTGPTRAHSFRTGAMSGLALYYLWLAGDLMTHSRRRFDRVYDLRARVAPAPLDRAATEDDADAYFATAVWRRMGLLAARDWRAAFAGTIARKVPPAEATARLAALETAGTIVPVALESEPRAPAYVLTEDLPLLEALHAGRVPEAWQPLGPTTEDEVTFLAPLEIVSARGRAASLFGFEYIWEVYKPAAQRRWGYYTLPILYGDRLVARADPRLDRATDTLIIQGYWPEPDVPDTAAYHAALAAGLGRLARTVGAARIAPAETLPAAARAALPDGGLP